ncbi:MAG: hypothetical protein E7233_08645 [Lachnospiraceae bacterium]|nr:hypothetical protein [Lachnospiraceae bacterium]
MIAFINATIIDGTGAAPKKGMKVLVDDKKITAVGRFIIIPDEAGVIDLKGAYLLPGLIDAHSHLGDHPFKDKPGIDTAQKSNYYEQMRKMTLDAGVTTIRSCGDHMPDTAMTRDMINNGELEGPRLICSGKSFLRKDGHPAVTVWACDQTTVDGCGAYPDTANEARRMVREAKDAGMDFIKIVVSDIHVSYWPEYKERLSDDILEAIVDESHKLGLRAVSHVDNLRQAELMVSFGIDEIHHLTNMGSKMYELPEFDGLFKEMCEKGIPLVPTISAPRAFEGARIERGCTDSPLDYQLQVLKRAYEFGVTFGAGCDSGCPGVPWGQCIWQEMAEYVYNLGMTPLEAIRCATSNNARLMEMENQIGVVHTGAFADLIVTEKDPSEKIENFASILMVIREGKIVRDYR